MKTGQNHTKAKPILKVLLVLFLCALTFCLGAVLGKDLSDSQQDIQLVEKQRGSTHQLANKAPVRKVQMRHQAPRRSTISKKRQNALTNMNSLVEKSEPRGSALAAAEIDLLERIARKKQQASRQRTKGNLQGRHLQNSVRPTSPSLLEEVNQHHRIDFTVQIASYPRFEDADRHAARLIKKGFPAFPVATKIKGRTWYRVSVGSFKTRKEALRYRAQLFRQTNTKNAIIQKITR